jgi:phage terminase large subunit-like protein
MPSSDSVRIVVSPGVGSKPPVTKPIADATPEELKFFFMWVILCGRGFGKSWTGSNWINRGARLATGEYMAIMGRDAHDVRAYCVEGDSGILKTAPADMYPVYKPSLRLLEYPNGVKAQIFYAEEPDTVRGPNNFRAWCDEPASYRDAAFGITNDDGKDTAMSNLLMTMRIGNPQMLVTGTPKPHKLIKDLINFRGAVIVRGKMDENTTLSDKFKSIMIDKFGGTRLGKQELDGEILDDNQNALWTRSWIERDRVASHPHLEAVVVAIDPMAGGKNGKSGIVVAGRWWHPNEERYHFYVLKDASIAGSPETWANCATAQYSTYMADRVIGERNNGGDMVESTMRHSDGNIPFKSVWASRGKFTRAEPISRLYEQGRVHHVGDDFEELEDQMCTWQPSPSAESPNNLDALVWAITDLMDTEPIGEDTDAFEEFWNPGDPESVFYIGD